MKTGSSTLTYILAGPERLSRNTLPHDRQAEELVAARAEAQQLSSAQAALQGAFVQLQTDMDCLRMRPTARHAC